MSLSSIKGVRIAGISTCVPPRVVDNLDLGAEFGKTEVRKVVAMAGVQYRHVVDKGVTSTDLCFEAAQNLLDKLEWAPASVTGLIMITQSPDYFLPSSSSVLHKWLGLSDYCAAFDIGLGCSSYPYGLYLASAMINAGGQQRILLLNGDTPSLFASPEDHTTTLLFSDVGSATAIDFSAEAGPSYFSLHSDGLGYESLIIKGGGFRERNPVDLRNNFVRMDGAAVFNFTIKRVPAIIREILQFSALKVEDVGGFYFHQSNRFMMKHLITKCGLPAERVPIILENFGNCGGPSVPLAITVSPRLDENGSNKSMMLGYGVGLSWGAAIVDLAREMPLIHCLYSGTVLRA